MILAPINGPEFSQRCRRHNRSPAPCRWPQLLRLLALTIVAGAFLTVALNLGKVCAETPALSNLELPNLNLAR